MNRQIVYPGQILPETTLLNMSKDGMIGLGKLAGAVFGTGTFVNGLTVAPNSPAALNVVVAPGEIYSLQNIDGAAFSSLAADTAHQIVKQGVLLDAITLATAAPATAGQSINYLIQATFSEVDDTPVLLPYYNSTNPSQAYSGPGNNGVQQATRRAGTIIVSAKAGISATTGSQTTPAPDAGYVGLYVVAVANGQTTVTAPNIAVAANAPFINTTLHGLAPAFGVSPTAPTPAQFDNSTKAATMAALQRALGNASGVRIYGAAGTISAADVGATHVLTGSNYTITLPSAPTVPAGSRFHFLSLGANITVARGGTDTFETGNGTPTSFVLNAGDTLVLERADVTTKWFVVGGSAQLQYATGLQATETVQGTAKVATQALTDAGTDDATIITPKKARNGFAASFAANGYINLPSWLGGFCLRWGNTGIASTSGPQSVTFALAFPTVCYGAVLGTQYATGTPLVSQFESVPTTTGFTFGMWNGSSRIAQSASYLAFGK